MPVVSADQYVAVNRSAGGRRFSCKPSIVVRSGLTLIELLAVVSILGILTAATAWNLQPRLETARMSNLLDKIAELDHRARDLAERSGQTVTLNVHVKDGEIRIANDDAPLASHVRLPRGFQISQLRIGKKTKRFGRSQILISRHGQSVTYGLLLESPTQVHRWLIVVGMSGQVLERKDDRHVDAILSPK